jgi:hypothetical protein
MAKVFIPLISGTSNSLLRFLRRMVLMGLAKLATMLVLPQVPFGRLSFMYGTVVRVCRQS